MTDAQIIENLYRDGYYDAARLIERLQAQLDQVHKTAKEGRNHGRK